MQLHGLVACASCDALQRIDAQQAQEVQCCARCGAMVHAGTLGEAHEALALVIAAGIAFAVANVFPIMAIDAGGNVVHATLVGASHALYASGMGSVAFVVLTTTVIAPMLDLVCMGMLLAATLAGRSARLRGTMLRLRETMRPWNMVEIFVLGALVAIVKLGDLAHVVLGAGIAALGLYIVAMTAATRAFNRTALWPADGGMAR